MEGEKHPAKTNKGGKDQKKRQRKSARSEGEIKGCRGQVVRERSNMPGAQSGRLGMIRSLGVPEWLCMRDLLIVYLKYRGRGDDMLSRLHRVSILLMVWGEGVRGSLCACVRVVCVRGCKRKVHKGRFRRKCVRRLNWGPICPKWGKIMDGDQNWDK